MWNYLNISLSNGSIGIAKDIVYNKDMPAPRLLKFRFADFGKDYIGKSFFPNDSTRSG